MPSSACKKNTHWYCGPGPRLVAPASEALRRPVPAKSAADRGADRRPDSPGAQDRSNPGLSPATQRGFEDRQGGHRISPANDARRAALTECIKDVTRDSPPDAAAASARAVSHNAAREGA